MKQPGASEFPIAPNLVVCDRKHLCYLLFSQPAKKLKLDHLGRPRAQPLELGQCLIQLFEVQPRSIKAVKNGIRRRSLHFLLVLPSDSLDEPAQVAGGVHAEQ